MVLLVDRRSAIICSHVLEDGLPILRAKRDMVDQDDPTDSGWQFLCDSGAGEEMATIRVISVEEVIQREPSLEQLLNSEVGSAWVRLHQGEAWVKETVA